MTREPSKEELAHVLWGLLADARIDPETPDPDHLYVLHPVAERLKLKYRIEVRIPETCEALDCNEPHSALVVTPGGNKWLCWTHRKQNAEQANQERADG